MKDRPMPNDILGMPREMRSDILMLNNKVYLVIVDYHSKFMVMK